MQRARTAAAAAVLAALPALIAAGCSGGASGECSGSTCPGIIDAGTDAGTGECVPESEAALCAALGRSCGSANTIDQCGNSRTLACGTCAAGTCSPTGACVTAPSCADACSSGELTPCTCSAGDPCGWSGDGYCDSECAALYPGNHFDDGNDCLTITDSLATACTSNSDCASELTCHDGLCVCCDDPGEDGALWECNPTTVTSIALSVCGITRASNIADDYGPAAVPNIGAGCYSGSPNNHWCAPQLQCVSRVEADEFRCGCCADIMGWFMCSYDVRFARTFCLGMSSECSDGSCLDCIGDACEPECPTTANGVCDEPEGTGTCPDGTDFTDCGP